MGCIRCGPCKMIAPVFDKLSDKYASRAVFLKVDVDQSNDIAVREGVRSMPTFKFFRNRDHVGTVSGANEIELESKLQELIASLPPLAPEPLRYAAMWHQGNNIGAAIGKAKNENKLFMVFVDDSSDQANRTAEAIEASSDLVTSLAVPLRLKPNEANGKNFAQIYPITVVPATFLIGLDGKVIEVVTGDVTVDSLTEKLVTATNINNEKVSEIAAKVAEALNQMAAEQTVQPMKVDGPTEATNNPENERQPGETLKSFEERMALVKSKLEMLQAKKAKEAEEKKILDEISRRDMGKAMAESKKKREEAEMLAAAEARRREKEEERVARQRVLDQIAADKAERKARQDRARLEAAGALPAEPAPKPVDMTPSVPVNCDQARIQFRLPSGTTCVQTFESDSCLLEAHNFLVEQKGVQSFSLSTTFPRRNFNEDDYAKTFRELQLLPSAALLVIAKPHMS